MDNAASERDQRDRDVARGQSDAEPELEAGSEQGVEAEPSRQEGDQPDPEVETEREAGGETGGETLPQPRSQGCCGCFRGNQNS